MGVAISMSTRDPAAGSPGLPDGFSPEVLRKVRRLAIYHRSFRICFCMFGGAWLFFCLLEKKFSMMPPVPAAIFLPVGVVGVISLVLLILKMHGFPRAIFRGFIPTVSLVVVLSDLYLPMILPAFGIDFDLELSPAWPIVALFASLIEDAHATNFLEKHGVEIGLLGAKMSTVPEAA